MAPIFKAPFRDGQRWTYSHHSREVRQALDFIRTDGNTGGAPVLASAAGRVELKFQQGGAGKYVVIKHGAGWHTYYFHLRSFSVRDGVRVRQGQEIGRTGSTGASSGDHLHYEQLRFGVGRKIRLNGAALAYPGVYHKRSLVSDNRLDTAAKSHTARASSVAPEDTPYNQLPVLKRGDRGVHVFFLQWRLRRLGFPIDKLPGAPFGPQTEVAVKAFQKRHKTPESIRPDGNGDGVVGHECWVDIIVRSLQANPVDKRPALRKGARGIWVGYLQAVLREAGHKIDKVDGFPFGPQTHKALAAFQAKSRITKALRADGSGNGVAGAETWAALDARWHNRT